MTPSILVTGGTGTLGRQVVPLLAGAGGRVRVLSRRVRADGDGAGERGGGVEYAQGDLLKGDGVEAALDGAEVVLHLAGGPKGDEAETRNLMRAASRAGVGHVVYISVIAADRVPLGYFRSKLAAEQEVAGSGVPWTTLRAAQFHDLVLTVLGKLAKLPVVPILGLRLEPVDTRDVAARLVELTLGEPAGLVPDLAGPKVYEMAELTRGYLKASGKRRLTMPVRMPGKAGRVYRADGNLSRAGASVGTRTWEEFLAERVR